MVFSVPVAERLSALPEMALPKASTNVTVMLAVELLSASATSGNTDTVDLLEETEPIVKVTIAVLVRVILSVVSVAERVLGPRLVELIVAKACPLGLVAEAGWMILTLASEADRLTFLPLTG